MEKDTIDKKTIIPIPSHMILSLEGFLMPTADKKTSSKPTPNAFIKRLGSDEYDAILELLPEPWTDEYM